ncbi:MAG TPA: AsmA-like C-terminal region-containing protein [Candidatus Acidoferrales bacterium]|nr:AsmA-like C-terminal region-containing protein [Candidatus Acidoferrales bacterium]
MKRGVRIVRYTVILLTVVIFGAIVLSKFVFSSDKLTALVLPRLSQILNRDVSAENVELSFFPTIGIRITGLRVANPRYGKFDSPYLLDSKAMVIDAKILPLFKNRLEINNVIFFSPTIFIEQNDRGRLNTDQLLSDTFYRETKNVRGSLSSFLLSNFEIVNGNIIWYDDKSGLSLKFLNADLSSRIKTVVEENKLTLNSNVNVEKFELWKNSSELYEGSPINVAAKLDYDKRHDQVNIVSEKASVFGVKLQSSVWLSFYPHSELSIYSVNTDSSARCIYGLLPKSLQDVILENSINGRLTCEFEYDKHEQNASAMMRVDLDDIRAQLQSGDSLSIRELHGNYSLNNDSSSLAFSMPSAVLGENLASVVFNVSPPKSGSVRVLLNLELKKLAHSLGMPGSEKLSGSIRAKYGFDYNSRKSSTSADGLITFSDALVQVPIGIDTLYTGECDGSISLKNNVASFNKLLLRMGGSDVVFSGTLTNYQNIFLGSATSIPQLKLRMVSKTFNTVGLLPHMILNIGRQTLAWIPRTNVLIDFNIGKFIFPNDTLTKLSGDLQIQDYFVRFGRLDYVSPMGTFYISGWTDYGQEGKVTFGLRTMIATWSFGKLFQRYLGGSQFVGGTGKGIVTLNGICDDSGKVDLAGLGGHGQFSISNAQIKDYSVLNKLFSFLGAPEKDSLKVSSTTFSFDVTDGRIYFNKMIAYGAPLDFRLDGWQGFDGTLDYKLTLRVHPPLSSQLSSYLRPSYPDLGLAPDGVLGMSLVAGGTTSDARFTIVGFNSKLASVLPPQLFLSSLK